MENDPFIDGLPIVLMVIFHGYVSHNQRVYPKKCFKVFAIAQKSINHWLISFGAPEMVPDWWQWNGTSWPEITAWVFILGEHSPQFPQNSEHTDVIMSWLPHIFHFFSDFPHIFHFFQIYFRFFLQRSYLVTYLFRPCDPRIRWGCLALHARSGGLPTGSPGWFRLPVQRPLQDRMDRGISWMRRFRRA